MSDGYRHLKRGDLFIYASSWNVMIMIFVGEREDSYYALNLAYGMKDKGSIITKDSLSLGYVKNRIQELSGDQVLMKVDESFLSEDQLRAYHMNIKTLFETNII